jgi:hypothetical protein
MKLFYFVFLTSLFITSCASYNYNGRSQNNSVQISSDNLKEYDAFTLNSKVNIGATKNGQLTARYRKLDKEDLDIYLVNPIYDSIVLNIKRAPRTDALLKDIGLGLFTFGVPIIVDVFKSDFYKVAPSTKTFNVHFEYKQSYMQSEFDKIAKSKNPEDFQQWLNKYQKSNIFQQVLDHKDSLELNIALSKESEAAIDEYIISHQGSNYLSQAQKIKDDMVAARELFEKSKTENTVEAYENFLKTFPRSLHNREAHKKLVDAAEKRAIASLKSAEMVSYINMYLIPNTSYLSSNEIDVKKDNITNAVDKQIVKEHITADTKKAYENYSNLWKRFVQIHTEVPVNTFNNFTQTWTYRNKIADLLYPKIKEANTVDKQSQLIAKVNTDFPKFEYYEPEKNVLITVIEEATKSSGTVKLFNVGFLPFHFDYMSERDPLKGRNFYTYKNAPYQSLQNITSEDVTTTNGQLSGVSKAYNGSKLDFTVSMNPSSPKEVAYYQNGGLVKTLNFLSASKTYEYEFENGVNLSLKALDNINKEGNAYVQSGSYDLAISTFENALKNNYPVTVAQNTTLQKSLTNARTQKAIYVKKQEEIRLAEEKKRREEEARRQEIARQEQERRRAEERNKPQTLNLNSSVANHVFSMGDTDGTPSRISGQIVFIVFYSSGECIMFMGSDLSQAIKYLKSNPELSKRGSWQSMGNSIWWTWNDSGRRSDDWRLDTYSGNLYSSDSMLKDLGGF